jgi:rSAM/selenodomain-associated transferase 2/rSAM/selenodomain-associated transferase 1
MPDFSVIIPTCNEEILLHRCLEHIRAIDPGIEIIVADGGSTDDTLKIAGEAGVAITRSQRSRGKQLNDGAAIASGDILVFLHSDTDLKTGCLEELKSFFNDDSALLTAFNLEFEVKHRLLFLFSRVLKYLPSLMFGDQCICVRRSFFEAMGGFDNLPLFEDLIFVMKAKKRARVRRLKAAVVTSARRYVRSGILWQQLVDIFYVLLFFLGVSPLKLADRYYPEKARFDTAVAIFMRYPRPGNVKTRMARQIGEPESAAIYRSCVQHLFKEFSRLPRRVRRYICFDGIGDLEIIRKWAGNHFLYVPQYIGDLGQRLEDAISTLLSHGHRKTIIIASDTPGISSGIVIHAAELLDNKDIVLGPDSGGGYYLVGMKKMYYRLFEGIPWSTPSVLEKTVETARELGLSVGLLPIMTDLDTAEDLLQFAKSDPGLASEICGDLPSMLDGLKLKVDNSDIKSGGS